MARGNRLFSNPHFAHVRCMPLPPVMPGSPGLAREPYRTRGHTMRPTTASVLAAAAVKRSSAAA